MTKNWLRSCTYFQTTKKENFVCRSKDFFVQNKLCRSFINTLTLSVQNPVNQNNVTQSVTYGNHCGGISSYTQWTYYNTIGIYMQINTRNCSFNITPFYYTSITGNGLQYDLTGSDSIYSRSPSGFRIYCRSNIGWTGTQLMNFSQSEKWDVIWVGIYNWGC